MLFIMRNLKIEKKYCRRVLSTLSEILKKCYSIWEVMHSVWLAFSLYVIHDWCVTALNIKLFSVKHDWTVLFSVMHDMTFPEFNVIYEKPSELCVICDWAW